MSYRGKKVNPLDPRGSVLNRRIVEKAVPETKIRNIRIVRNVQSQPIGLNDIPENPTGALDVFSAEEFEYDAGILGRNIKRKFFG